MAWGYRLIEIFKEIFKFTSIFFIFLLFNDSMGDDLLSARCQSKCLYDLEQRVKDNSELRRQLKHQIVNICKADPQCSSCSLPCRESFFDNQTCTKQLCQDTADIESCRHSCIFLEKISKGKPGSCPKQLLASVVECTAACDNDGQCPEAEKCCTTGCSRQCVSPIDQDSRLLPIPDGISVQERKRRRSAIIRWIMKRMSREHVTTNSNLFVLQWRWGVHKDETTMTPWQTIMVKNKMYAILKHLLAPGRFYIFRVGSVNVHGSKGFSQPTQPFKLTKEVKAPTPPLNFSVEAIEFDKKMKKWTPKIAWQPPTSDLPLKDYQLSWWRTTSDFAKAYETRMGQKIIALQGKRSAINFPYDDEDDTGSVDGDRKSTIIPSYATKTQIQALEPEQLYMVELFATVDSTDGELRGEPAVLFIKTNSIVDDNNPLLRYEIENNQVLINENSGPSNNKNKTQPMNDVEIVGFKVSELEDAIDDDDSNPSEFRADIKAPYVENGNLMTTVSWLDHPLCSPNKRDFLVHVKDVGCPKPYPSENHIINHCVVDVSKLEFDCKYVVLVEDIISKQPITKTFFNTLSCKETPSLNTIECAVPETTTTRGIYISSPIITCNILHKTHASCAWPALGVHQDEHNNGPLTTSPIIIGYRTILQPNMGNSIVQIVPPKKRTVDFTDLNPKYDYRFAVQAITTNGLGTELENHFNTRNESKKIQLDTFPILELPLGSTGAFTLFSYNCILLPLFLLLRLFVCIL